MFKLADPVWKVDGGQAPRELPAHRISPPVNRYGRLTGDDGIGDGRNGDSSGEQPGDSGGGRPEGGVESGVATPARAENSLGRRVFYLLIRC